MTYSSKSVKFRLGCVCCALGFFLFLLVGRLFYVQVVSGKTLTKRATSQWMRDIPLSGLRGTIYDRNGAILASSYTTYDVYVRPNTISDKQGAAELLSSVLNLNYDDVFEKVCKSQSEVLIAKQIEKTVASRIIEAEISGIYLSENSSREYDYDSLLCQVLGFCNADGDGQFGLEAYYNKYLAGVDGVLVSETDNAGREIAGTSATYIPSTPGMNLTLTIDLDIQKAAESALQVLMQEQSPNKATAIVMDPKTGEILAMAISPSFDLNNVPRDDIASLMQMVRNSAIQDCYEPGSTFKILTGAIAMKLGLADENSYFYCPGYRIINGVKINCARRSGHGSQSLEQGFMNSCNCVFMDLVQKIGVERFYQKLSEFFIGETLPVDFASASSGILMNKASVTSSDLARMGFGQSIAVSPLGLVTAVSSILNGGSLMKPHFLQSISSNSGDVVYMQNPSKVRQVVSSQVSSSICKMLEAVVEKGGGKKAQISGYRIGGKTGTAQKYENGVIAQGKYIASFLGTYPANDPDYVVLVIADEPHGSSYGATAAAPYASLILQKIFEAKNILPSEKVVEEEKIIMPNLLGMTQTEAAGVLAGLGLYYIFEGEEKVVSSQIPSSGTQIPKGDVVLARFLKEEQNETE